MFQPYRVTGTSQKSTLGSLMLTEAGLWSFVRARSAENPPQMLEGELVAFVPHQSEAPSHLFGVVLARSWGVMLQRLDGQKVSTAEVDGELVPLGTDAQLRRWGICRGTSGDEPSASIAASTCLKTSGGAWRIFRADANARLSVSADWGLAPPIRTDGLVHGGRSVVRDEGLDGGWVAVPTRSPSPHVAHARVLLEPDCPDLDVSQSLQPVEILRGEAPFGAHPVDIEAAAVASGADVLVRCTKEAVIVAAPTLYRPLLSIPNSSARGSAFGAMRPISIARDSGSRVHAAAQQSTILLAAALSTGSVLAADFYLEQALIAAPDDDIARRLAVEFMQVPSAAGRPEVALRAGREASRGAWHRQNSASFVLGSAWVFAALGQPRAHAEAMNRVQELAEAPESDQMRRWVVWTALRDGLDGPSSRGKTNALDFYDKQALSKWLEAAELLVGWAESRTQSLADTESGLNKAFEPSVGGCERPETCKLDVYGRNLAEFVEKVGSDDPRRLVNELNTLGVAALRPGFRLSALDAGKLSPAWKVAVRAAAMPLLAAQARDQGFEELAVEVSGAWRSQGVCLDVEAPDLLVGRIESLRGQDGRIEEGDAALAATTWLLSSGLKAACESPAAFVTSLEAGVKRHPKLAMHAGPLFEALVSRADEDERSMLLRQFADFTAEHEKGAACKRWNLALAVSEANVGRLNEAESDLSQAINCEASGESAYGDTEQLLIAYLRFEKSASISEDITPEVRAKLSALIRREQIAAKPNDEPVCLGLLPLDYRLERFVHQDVASLAVAMPEPPRDELALETSSKSVARGVASLAVARRLLGEARPTEAARALTEAQQAFERIEHAAGLRRISFLETVIFDGDLQAYLASDKPGSASKTGLVLSKPGSFDKISAVQWARALRAGKAREILAATQHGTATATEHGLHAVLAASLLVQTEEQSAELWRYASGRGSFDVLCP
jgi:hypothetical protein